jgi:hypothetical protein
MGKTIVIIAGGFHPYHAGHHALYQSAQRTFPDAEVFVAATNDTSSRPFPFAVKEKLARLAGVDAGHFVQVKSPFRAEEITAKFDPSKDVLIFVRSEKDANTPPRAGGVKKDGSPSYLQPLLDAKRLEPFSKHAYMAYLPTVEFGPGMTSATQIRSAWPGLNERRKTALVMSLYPKTQTNPKLAATVVKLLDAAIGGQDLAEGMWSKAQDESEREHGWRATLVDEIDPTTFEVKLTNSRSKESANFVVRPVDMLSHMNPMKLQIDSMDIRDLQTGKTNSITSDDAGIMGHVFDAVDALFWDTPALQKRLRAQIDNNNVPSMMPGLDQRQSAGGDRITGDQAANILQTTQNALTGMRGKKGSNEQGVAEGFKNIYAEFSGYGNYMQGRAINVFNKAGLEIVSKDYTDDDDIQTYVVKGDRQAIEKAGEFLERNAEQFGGYHFVKQGVAEGRTK